MQTYLMSYKEYNHLINNDPDDIIWCEHDTLYRNITRLPINLFIYTKSDYKKYGSQKFIKIQNNYERYPNDYDLLLMTISDDEFLLYDKAKLTILINHCFKKYCTEYFGRTEYKEFYSHIIFFCKEHGDNPQFNITYDSLNQENKATTVIELLYKLQNEMKKAMDKGDKVERANVLTPLSSSFLDSIKNIQF